MNNIKNRLMGSVSPSGGPVRLLDEEEVEEMVALREQSEDDEETP